jgi:hypothetical protein
MTIEGVDYSTGPPTLGQLRAAGKRFVVRYVSEPGQAKNLTRVEADGLQTAGLAIAIVMQRGKTQALAGSTGGVADARSARDQVVKVGGPANGGVIYFAVDFDPTAAQMATVLSYVGTAASVLGKDRTGVYGGLRTVRAVLDAGLCRYAWQTRSWSGGVWEPRAQLQQYAHNLVLGSGLVDLDRATVADYGQWGGQGLGWWLQPLGPGQLDQLRGVFERALE